MFNRSLEIKKARRHEVRLLSVSKAHINSLSSYPLIFLSSRKSSAFTLAEILTTLGVIGIVAAITMPVLMTKINDRVNFERHANIAYKVTQAMEQMRAQGKLVQYANTDAFVDELQKYLKIQKRCSASDIAECWPTETITNGDGEEYNVSDTKKRKNLLPNATTGNTDDDNVGLILADGASIILTYDNTTSGKDIGDKITAVTINNPKGQKIAYSTTAAEGIDFVTDVNGKKGPNKEGKDIKSFSVATFAKSAHPCDDGPVGCIYKLPTWSPANCNTTAANYAGADYCGQYPSGYENDYWAGAKKACHDAGMTLPTLNQLKTIYQNKNSYTGELSALSSINDWVWSSSEYNTNDAWHLNLGNGYESENWKFLVLVALCLGQ